MLHVDDSNRKHVLLTKSSFCCPKPADRKLRATMTAVDMSAEFGYKYVRVNLDFEVGQPLPHPYARVPLGETQVQKFACGEHAVLMILWCGCGIPYQLLDEGEMDGYKLFLYRRVKSSERDAILICRVGKGSLCYLG